MSSQPYSPVCLSSWKGCRLLRAVWEVWRRGNLCPYRESNSILR